MPRASPKRIATHTPTPATLPLAACIEKASRTTSASTSGIRAGVGDDDDEAAGEVQADLEWRQALGGATDRAEARR